MPEAYNRFNMSSNLVKEEVNESFKNGKTKKVIYSTCLKSLFCSPAPVSVFPQCVCGGIICRSNPQGIPPLLGENIDRCIPHVVCFCQMFHSHKACAQFTRMVSASFSGFAIFFRSVSLLVICKDRAAPGMLGSCFLGTLEGPSNPRQSHHKLSHYQMKRNKRFCKSTYYNFHDILPMVGYFVILSFLGNCRICYIWDAKFLSCLLFFVRV